MATRNSFTGGGVITQHAIPGAYSRIATPASAVGLTSSGNVCFIGVSTGGTPGVLLSASNQNEARQILRSGPLFDVVFNALNPGGNLVPQTVYFVRVNTATQATEVLLSGANDQVIRLRSRDYGLYTNLIRVTTTGTNTKSVTIELGNQTETFNNIQRQSINIHYTGNGTSAVLNVTATELNTTITGSSDGSGSQTVEFNAFSTIEQVVGFINTQAGYTASLVDGVDGDSPSNQLDLVSNLNIRTNAQVLSSNVQAVIDTINSGSSLVTAEFVSHRALFDNVTDLYLDGGSEGSSDPINYGNVLTTLEGEDVQLLGTDNNNSAIHAMVNAHVRLTNSTEGRNERQAILGGGSGDGTLEATITEARAINNESVYIAYGRIRDFDANGNITEQSSVIFAAKLLGQASASGIIQPLTFNEVTGRELITRLTRSNLETAILGGVIVPKISSNGTIQVTRSISTFQQPNLIKNEFSMQRIALFTSKDLREFVETRFVGRGGDTSVLASIRSEVTNRLNFYRSMNYFVDNPSWNNLSWRNLVITINGDQVNVTYSATITAPINFIFVLNQFSVIASI